MPTSPVQVTRHAEVVGAGFAGLTTATALALHGWSVRLHEKTAELREEGAGIVLWHNGLAVLEAIGALPDVLADSMTPPWYETRRDGKAVSKEDFDGLPWRCMTRQHLHRVLVSTAERAGVEILVDSEVTDADPSGSLTTASGKVRRAGLIIGADGAGSRVRDAVGMGVRRQRHVDGITRLLVSRHVDELGPGEWDNVIDFWNSGTESLRILYTPCNERQLYLALMSPHTFTRGVQTPIDLALWSNVFPELTAVLVEASSVRGRYRGYQTTVVDRWTQGRIALIGDSAHAMCPALAQGAGCALVNGFTLARALASETDVDDAIARWEREMRPLTDRCQERSAWFATTRSMANGNQFTETNLETAKFDPRTFGPLALAGSQPE